MKACKCKELPAKIMEYLILFKMRKAAVIFVQESGTSTCRAWACAKFAKEKSESAS